MDNELRAGIELWRLVQEELAGTSAVTYHSELFNMEFKTPEEYESFVKQVLASRAL